MIGVGLLATLLPETVLGGFPRPTERSQYDSHQPVSSCHGFEMSLRSITTTERHPRFSS
jgi:hypothetical protein